MTKDELIELLANVLINTTEHMSLHDIFDYTGLSNGLLNEACDTIEKVRNSTDEQGKLRMTRLLNNFEVQ